MTISVQSITLTRALEIEASSVVSAQMIGSDVILTTAGGTVFNAGSTTAVEESASDIYPAFIKAVSSFDTVSYDALILDWVRPGASLLEPAIISPQPAQYPGQIDWSPDGKYLAVPSLLPPYVSWYKRTGDSLAALADPVPDDSAVAAAWSPNGQYLAVLQNSTPFVTLYKRSGDTLTRLSDPGQPASGGYSVSWSADSTYLALPIAVSPFIYVYKRTGDTLAKIPDPSILPAFAPSVVAWSPDGSRLAVGGSGAPSVIMYKRSGDVLSKTTEPGEYLADTTFLDWSPDGRYLASSSYVSPYVMINRRAGETYTRIGSLSPAPAHEVGRMKWTPDGHGLFISKTSAGPNAIRMYRLKSDAEVLEVPDIAGVFANALVSSFSFTPDGTYLAIADNTLPSFLRVFKLIPQMPPGTPTPITQSP